MNYKENENLDNTPSEKTLYNSEYERGIQEGRATANTRSYQSGFRNGLQV